MEQSYPKYIKRGEYIGVFAYLDFGEFPVYRFEGGYSLVDDYELEHGSNNPDDLKQN